MRYIIILSLLFLFFLSVPLEAFSNSLLFYEPLEDLDSVIQNGGICGSNGCPNFVEGVVGNSGDFSGSKLICYPLQNNFDLNKGTIEFWVKTPPPNDNHLGFFDIGTLWTPNSWGIFKNVDHMIMEVKNDVNSYDQAWSPGPVSADDKWHCITAVWERQEETTNFKICLDGVCKPYYDGITSNSFPDLNGEFCVGWSGWYGYSESLMDEFKIFDYVKSDADIYRDYECSSPYRPVINMLGENLVVIDIGTQYVDAGATAYDREDGDITEKITVTGLDEIDTGKVGTYRISYNVSDSDGNPAKEKIRMVYVVDMNVKPVERAYEHLYEVMDKFHKTFDVYTDLSAAGNHFVTLGKMANSGDEDKVEINPGFTVSCFSGDTCVENKFYSDGDNWGGWYFMNGVLEGEESQPKLNWGDYPNAGFDLTGAIKLTFWAKGEKGGERVEFFALGVGRNPVTGEPIKPYPDSSAKVSPGFITLNNTWTQYTISLTGIDLSYVLGGFGWVTNASVNNNQNITFYLDDIKYDKSRLSEPRFLVSYETIPSCETFDNIMKNVAFSYDNALVLSAFLARGTEEDILRAKLLADAFVYAINNDRYFDDSRLRNGYQGGDLILFPGWRPHGRTGTIRMPGWWDTVAQKWYEDELNVSTHTGNMAWPMLALLSYHETQGDDKYLETAKTMGEWIERETRDERGNGGYIGGYEGWEQTANNPIPQRKLLYKATEHNIDLYSAFMRLYYLTNEQKWLERAEHAKRFVDSMWNPESGHFWTGTLEDGVTINKSNIPVDVQAWAVMAFNDYYPALTWAENNCYTELDGYKGFDFNNDKDGVWFEGTAHMALAYQLNKKWDKSEKYIAELRKAQQSAINANGKGIVAASHDGVTTGFDWEYLSRLHIGATAWYIFAESGFNPYWGTTSTIPGIDLIELSVSNPPANAVMGSSFSATDTVKNQGSVSAGSSTTRYYLSLDIVKSASDKLLRGTRSVPALLSGTSSTGVATVKIPSMADGDYYLIACADDTKKVTESNEKNNCIASQIKVHITGADLVETSVSNPPATAVLGSSFAVTDTAKNQGTAEAGASVTRYYFSLDAIKSGKDKLLIGSRSVPPLPPGTSSTGTATVKIPSMVDGDYYLIACADDTKKVTESNEKNTNNCIASPTKVHITGPDLVEVSVSNPPSSASRGSSFTVTDTVKNQGTADAGASVTRYYLSLDAIKGSTDRLLTGSRSMPPLIPMASSNGSTTVTIPTTMPLDSYYLIACADDTKLGTESNETNNCITSQTKIQVNP